MQHLLLEGIETLEIGITVFDGNLRLLTANRRFCRMLDFPEILCQPGVSFEDFLRHNARRGEYGPGDVEQQVAQRLALARKFEPHHFERSRPDGTILDVRGHPLPSGGMITIYTDITEQRRHESALQALSEELERRVEERTATLREREAELARKTAMLELVTTHTQLGITLVNADLQLEYCNPQFIEIMQFPETLATPGRPFEAFIRYNAERGEYGPGDLETQVQERVALARQGRAHRFERTRPNGASIEIIGSPTADGGFVTTYLKITERKRAEAALRNSETQLRNILGMSPVGVALLQATTRTLQFCNERFAQLMGSSTAELTGRTPEGRITQLLDGWQPGDTESDRELALPDADDHSRWIVLSLRPTTYHNEEAVLIWVYDITELHQAREQLNRLAHHDALTGMPNRRYFEHAAQQSMARAGQHKTRGALLFIDLDGFKEVNDRHGHAVGDQLLQALAHEISARLRKSDVIARLGGDEFAIITENDSEDSDLEAFALKLIDLIAQTAQRLVADCRVSASIGIARYNLDGPDLSTLLNRADSAMYRAKAAGKAAVRFAPPSPDNEASNA